MAQNGSNSSQNFDFLTQKFKMAQTHLKSFNGRQGGILQSISGVSGASGGLKSQNFDFLTQKFNLAQNGSNSSQTQNGSNSYQTHLKNSKWLKMAQTHLKMAQTHLKLKMAQTHLKLISKIQNGSKWLKLISKF